MLNAFLGANLSTGEGCLWQCANPDFAASTCCRRSQYVRKNCDRRSCSIVELVCTKALCDLSISHIVLWSGVSPYIHLISSVRRAGAWKRLLHAPVHVHDCY